MKIKMILKGMWLAGFAAIAAMPGCDDESEPVTGDEQDATSSVDDVFAKTVLAGGCTVTIAKTGKNVKTKGKDGSCPTTASGILDLLEKDAKNQISVFAVSEEGDIKPGKTTPYRFVVAIDTGNGKAEQLFLSLLGSGEGVSDDFVEVMSFSEKKGVYAFYDVKDGAWTQEGDGTQVKTDALAQHGAPAFRCQGCHTTAMPLMKELHDSWANWNSTWFSMGDPASKDALFNRLFSKKERGDDLELLVIAGTKAATKTRVDKAVKEKKLKPMLTQLMCDVGEPALIAAHSKNSKRTGTVETFSSMLPTSILLNGLFKTPKTGTGDQKGLDNVLNMNIPSLGSAKIDSASYVKALTTIGQTIGGQKGDAMFPMSNPEKSYADVQVVQDLVSRNLLDKNLIADVMMTDFSVSTFSTTRCDLAATIPTTWTSVDELRTKWSAALTSSTLRGAKGLKARLDNTTDFDGHATKLEKFVKACNDRGTANKDAYALDLLKIMSQRRREFEQTYEQVVESNWLIPADTLKSKPGASRLNGDTCVLEAQTTKFIGEEG